MNIWVLPLTTVLGEKEPTPLLADEASGFCWTADSKYIIFLQDLEGDESCILTGRTSHGDSGCVDLAPYPSVRIMSIELSTDDRHIAFVQMNY